jgi:hypothetical protein
MFYKFLRKALSIPGVHRALRRLYHTCAPASLPASNVETGIPEVTPLNIRYSPILAKRLNLIVPALSLKHVFGGISTALDFFEKLAPAGMDVRIIVSDEVIFDRINNPRFSKWNMLSLDEEDCEGSVIVCAADRFGKTLAVREGDIFVATAWWTAILAKNLLEEKAELYRKDVIDRFVYLIQDFEPGFYPWSTRYALAEASYHYRKNIIPVFNTRFLKEFFDLSGYHFDDVFVFDPVLNSGLKSSLQKLVITKRERSILVYGRPGVARNVFEIIIMALRSAVSRHDMRDWAFYSAGESHPDIDLGSGSSLVSLGKLSLHEYSKILNEMYAGISLMVSPHPSYPPLEMAAFGVKVITNGYANKHMEQLSPNIFSVDFLSPEAVAGQLISLVKNYCEENVQHNLPKSKFMEHFISCPDPFQDLVPEIRNKIFK